RTRCPTPRGTRVLGRRARSHTTGVRPRRRDRRAAPQPDETRSPIAVRQAPERITGGPRSRGIAAVGGKPLLGERQVRRRRGKVAGRLRDAVPQSLQVTDLFGLWQGAETRGGGDASASASVPAFPGP